MTKSQGNEVKKENKFSKRTDKNVSPLLCNVKADFYDAEAKLHNIKNLSYLMIITVLVFNRRENKKRRHKGNKVGLL